MLLKVRPVLKMQNEMCKKAEKCGENCTLQVKEKDGKEKDIPKRGHIRRIQHLEKKRR